MKSRSQVKGLNLNFSLCGFTVLSLWSSISIKALECEWELIWTFPSIETNGSLFCPCPSEAARPQSINININTAAHLKLALGCGRILNIIRDRDTFLMRSTAEWMHCLAVVICKIQSSYSTKSYFQSDARLAGPNGCGLKPLGRCWFFSL